MRRPPRIYIDTPLISGKCIPLGEKSHHISQVLRLSVGAELVVFDGEGQEYSARLVEVQKRAVIARLENPLTNRCESPLELHVLQGIARGDKMDFCLQKMVELGVRHITPVFSDFCTVKLSNERVIQKMRHWQAVIQHAAEQSGRAWLSQLHWPIPLQQALHTVTAECQWIAHPGADQRLRDCQPARSCVLAVGPEGGFSEQELRSAVAHNFQTLGFGPRILRSETAALAIIAAVQALWGDA